MAFYPVLNRVRFRVDDRIQTIGVNNIVFARPVYPVGALVPLSLHGYLLVGIDAGTTPQSPHFCRVMPVYDQGVFFSILEAFGGSIPQGYGIIKWSCFFAPRLTGFNLQVLGAAA